MKQQPLRRSGISNSVIARYSWRSIGGSYLRTLGYVRLARAGKRSSSPIVHNSYSSSRLETDGSAHVRVASYDERTTGSERVDFDAEAASRAEQCCAAAHVQPGQRSDSGGVERATSVDSTRHRQDIFTKQSHEIGRVTCWSAQARSSEIAVRCGARGRVRELERFGSGGGTRQL